MLCPGIKRHFSAITFIFLILFFLGLFQNPDFFLDSVLAEVVQTSVVITVCGNGIVETGEECDDGNSSNADSCLNTCQDADCGDGYVWSGTEECDDGNNVSGDGCSAACQTESGTPPPPPPGGGGGTTPTVTKVILQGKAYPQAKITVLTDGKVSTVITGDSQANFKVELTTLTAGTYTFGLWAEDKSGRKSITFSFTTNVTSGMTTTVSGIFIPPTIELEKVNLSRGEILNILGQTAPESEITISVESQEIIKKSASDEEGDWDYSFDTAIIDEGSHTTRAKAESPEGLLSSFSKVLGFYIGKYGATEICSKADFNKDGKTNLVDFSIMLFWWGKYNPCVDQNQNETVNLPDFSILMYWWTG